MTTAPTAPDRSSTAITGKPAEPAVSSTAITEKPPEALPSAPPPPAAPPKGPPTWPIKVDFAILGMLLILTFLLASFAATNSDLWMHLAIGKRYSQGQFGFGADPFSWASKDIYWVHHAWLYSWLVYGIYAAFGGAGLIIMKAAIFTAAIGVLSRIGWNESNRWFVLICLVMAALAASTRVFMQPMVVSFLFLAITLFVLDRAGVFAFGSEAGGPDRARGLWYLPPLFALWANLDAWFILGPILVGLCWAAAGLTKWFPNGNPVPAKLLGQVFGAGLLACVVNPHHVRVFQLPPELAYLAITVTEPIGLTLPDAIFGAGRAFREIAAVDQNIMWTASSLSSNYWQARTGMNPAGMAVFLLLVLGLVAFTLTALVKQQRGAPTLHVGRFLPWLVFGVLALALYRFIPFAALIAAPLTAMTLGEFVLWQQKSNAVSADKRERGLNLARVVTVPFLVLLVALAWPGWLSAPGGVYEYNAPRRVAWQVRTDTALRKAAQVLADLKAQGECGNVFNTSIELADYLPWFAPEVQYYIDSRFALHPGKSATLERVRAAILDPGLPAADWQNVFKENNVDQVALKYVRRTTTADAMQALLRWWLDDRQWRQRHADERTLVFSWAGAGKHWPATLATDDLNRQAFGDVPDNRRPPGAGAAPPPAATNWTLYYEGLPPGAGHGGECRLRHLRYELANNVITDKEFRKQRASVMAVSATYVALLGGGTMTIPGVVVPHLLADGMAPPLDRGPPALPILMLRTARRAVAEAPLDAESHHVLLIANEVLRTHQEDYWIGHRRAPFTPHPSRLRDAVRQAQLSGSAYQLTQLQPDNVQFQLLLAGHYLDQDIYDLALEHRQKALKAFEEQIKNAPINPKDKVNRLKQFADANQLSALEESVRQRLAQFKASEKHKPLDRITIARYEKFQEIMRDGKVMESPLGLGKKALDLLLAIDTKSLTKDETSRYLETRFELLLAIGNVEAVADNLKEESVRKALPPVLHAHYRVIAAGALGDYAAMEEALPVIENAIRENIKPITEEFKRRRGRAIASFVLAPTQPSPITRIGAAQAMPLHWFHHEVLDAQTKLYNDLFNTMTLRGIAVLEAGDTKKARAVFQQTLSEAGSEHYFADRVIAQRYFDLLKEQGR